ncbi:MAG: discoidin domain-containing protein [Verrucomicrobia bacterium]|nr:MAG: discoidin domain-containing protein [Verrucomicrobiota bacterium]
MHRRAALHRRGLIEKVTPTHTGPAFLHGLRTRHADRPNLASASGQLAPHTDAARSVDSNYATRWAPADDDASARLRIDLGAPRELRRQELLLEYPWKGYTFAIEASLDGEAWTTLHTANAEVPAGSPLVIERTVRARYLRLVAPSGNAVTTPSVIEWRVF